MSHYIKNKKYCFNEDKSTERIDWHAIKHDNQNTEMIY